MLIDCLAVMLFLIIGVTIDAGNWYYVILTLYSLSKMLDEIIKNERRKK